MYRTQAQVITGFTRSTYSGLVVHCEALKNMFCPLRICPQSVKFFPCCQMKEESVRAVEAANRWTDNIFSVQDWVKKKYPGFPQVASALSLLVLRFLETLVQYSISRAADPYTCMRIRVRNSFSI
jgi:hypothetical protein